MIRRKKEKKEKKVSIKYPLTLLCAGAVVVVSFLATQQTMPPIAAAGERITLPAPDKEGGKPLMQALALRKSERSFSADPLSEREVSDLLWAAWGVNRPNGRRTVPTANNRQRVEVYAAKADGVWRYDGPSHSLEKVLERDALPSFGGAPLTLIYAVEDDAYGAMHVGSIYQNVGLYCASAGLANVVKASGADDAQKKLPLPAGYKVLIVQSVGRPD